MKYRIVPLVAILLCINTMQGIGFFSKLGQAWTKVFVRTQNDLYQFAQQYHTEPHQEKRYTQPSSWRQWWPSFATWRFASLFYPAKVDKKKFPGTLNVPAYTERQNMELTAAPTIKAEPVSEPADTQGHVLINFSDVLAKTDLDKAKNKAAANLDWRASRALVCKGEYYMQGNNMHDDLQAKSYRVMEAAIPSSPEYLASRHKPQRFNEPVPTGHRQGNIPQAKYRYMTSTPEEADRIAKTILEKTQKEILKDTTTAANHGIHVSENCREALWRVMRGAFEPAYRAQTSSINKPLLALAIELKQAGNKVSLFANVSQNLIQTLAKDPDFKELFDVFPVEEIITSSHLGAAKPSPEAFAEFLKRKQITNPARTRLIDDQHIVLRAAQEQFGIAGIQYDASQPVDNVRTYFEQQGFLPTADKTK